MAVRKRVCVIRLSSFVRDSRARRTARTMARHADVDVFTIPARPGDTDPGAFREDGVRLHALRPRRSRLAWLLRHTLFFLEPTGLSRAVRASGARYDVVYAHDLPASFAALRLARRHGAKVIYDVHDLYLETINQLLPERARFPKSLFFALSKFAMRTSGSLWERWFIRRTDLVVTPTAGCLEYLERRYSLPNGHLLPNFPALREVVSDRRLPRECGVPEGGAVVLYHGSLGRGRFLESIVRSAEWFSPGTVLAVVGNGHLESELKTLAEGTALRGKIRFLDHVPYDELLPLAAGASLGLVLIEPINLSKRYSLANKFTEYMAAGVPVLASDLEEHRRVLEETDAGFLIDLTTPRALAERINAILEDRAVLAAKGRNGRDAYRSRYNWEAHEPAFERAFLDVLGAP